MGMTLVKRKLFHLNPPLSFRLPPKTISLASTHLLYVRQHNKSKGVPCSRYPFTCLCGLPLGYRLKNLFECHVGNAFGADYYDPLALYTLYLDI